MTLDGSPQMAAAAADLHRVRRIVLIDRQRLFRQAMRALLASDEEFSVVGDAGEAREALSLIEALKPDVVVTDLHLGNGSGDEHIAEIRARFPNVAILVLTALRAHDVAAQVRRAGALGYLLKDEGQSELRAALREVAARRNYRTSRRPIRAGRTPPRGRSLGSRAVCLTERQREVLRSLALGHGTREIAARLGVSVKAVHKLRERLRHALEVDGTAALTRFAVREGFADEGALSR